MGMAKGWSWYIEDDQRIRANRSLYHSRRTTLPLSLFLSLCPFTRTASAPTIGEINDTLSEITTESRRKNVELVNENAIYRETSGVTNDVLIGSLVSFSSYSSH